MASLRAQGQEPTKHAALLSGVTNGLERKRLAVWVEKGALPSFSGQSFVKLAVEGFKSKSERARGASPAWDYYASFEVVDTSATLTMTVLNPTTFDTSVSRRPIVLSS